MAENLVLQNEYAAPSAVQAGERVSVIGHLPADGGGGRSLILFGHPDGEPVSRTDEWSKDPFAAEIIDGRIYGWGVADDLMGVAAGVCALDVLAERGTKLKGDVMMCSTPSKRNANGVTAVMQNMELAGTADAAVYLHPAESGAGLREIKALASGQLKFKITVCGSPPVRRVRIKVHWTWMQKCDASSFCWGSSAGLALTLVTLLSTGDDRARSRCVRAPCCEPTGQGAAAARRYLQTGRGACESRSPPW